MSSGPIEFLGENPRDDMPDSEFGGDDGLIQPRRAEVLSGDPAASGGRVLDGSAVGEAIGDAAGVVRRAGMRTLSSSEGWTGVEDPAWAVAAAEEGMGPDAVVDPATGRAVAPDLNVEGGEPGEFEDLRPGR